MGRLPVIEEHFERASARYAFPAMVQRRGFPQPHGWSGRSTEAGCGLYDWQRSTGLAVPADTIA